MEVIQIKEGLDGDITSKFNELFDRNMANTDKITSDINEIEKQIAAIKNEQEEALSSAEKDMIAEMEKLVEQKIPQAGDFGKRIEIHRSFR